VSYYTPKYFAIWELVPPEIYDDMKDSAFILFDDRLLRAADCIRERFDKPMTVNNWKLGGPYQQRGFRTTQIGIAKHSPHRYGRAIDFDISGLTADMVRKEILANQQHDDMVLISGMEMGTSWIHVDVANRYSTNGIVTFNA
jgi:hypothetical protein